MKRTNSLREAKRKFKELCRNHIDFMKHGGHGCTCGLCIFHRKGTQTWWIGSEMEWLNH